MKSAHRHQGSGPAARPQSALLKKGEKAQDVSRGNGIGVGNLLFFQKVQVTDEIVAVGLKGIAGQAALDGEVVKKQIEILIHKLCGGSGRSRPVPPRYSSSMHSSS